MGVSLSLVYCITSSGDDIATRDQSHMSGSRCDVEYLGMDTWTPDLVGTIECFLTRIMFGLDTP